ncbi:MAG: protein kinase family protein [candidate division NC10 bacterium]|nr:protein kinase family protein [candidate division NC10 bacterium]MDE2320754.1 protein kinase family protein [candidate division NC10 bacterium]
MDHSNRWKIIEELPEGGQGKVYRALDGSKFDVEGHLRPALRKAIVYLAQSDFQEPKKDHFDAFRESVVALVQMEDPSHHGALKVLHQPKEARDPDRADARIRCEIQAMSDISHPNLLKILDADPESKWFVSQYYPKGTLAKNQSRFFGDFARALKAFRPLVEGASELHKKGFVHRDIKPQNIFVDAADNLVLGDFGLIYFVDTQRTRISDKWENVGSRDWMPGWAMGMRVETITPAFDVFCLGKVLWYMVSGLPILRLWYFESSEFNVETKFPEARAIEWANPLLKKCIVEHEKDCLPDASRLLAEIDQVLSLIDDNACRLDLKAKRRCKVCGLGTYRIAADRKRALLANMGVNPTGAGTYRIFTCSHCGHVQWFYFDGGEPSDAWRE